MNPEDVKPASALKSAMIRPRVIVSYPDPNFDRSPGKMVFAAGFIEGCSGKDVLVELPMGMHEFSRDDGTWRCGDCLNYKDAKILEFEQVKGGYGGSVEDYRKSLPMCAAS
jgi:hypothetical protein